MMQRARMYTPLIGFVVPTVIIGYGFVIPRSCIAGVNELSVGFGTTILGAVVTYILGLRAASPVVCTKPPWSVRIGRAINRQAASPSGFFGWLIGRIWAREHARLNDEVVEALDVRPDARVLELCSGPGEALSAIVARAPRGRVLGIDGSEVMVNAAMQRNRADVARGAVEVRRGDADTLDLAGETFDRIFCVHGVYFFRDRSRVLGVLARALESGGKLLIAFRPESDDIPERFREPTYRFPIVVELESELVGNGLVIERSSPSRTSATVHFVIARRA